jgi:Flp pilus assembly pilin Flp
MQRSLLQLWKSAKFHLSRLWEEESGQDLVEYSLLLVFVSLAAIATIDRLGDAVNRTFHNIAHVLTDSDHDLF